MAKKTEQTISKKIFILAIFLSFVFTSAILFSGNNLGIQDWDYYFSFFEVARRSILTYHQFPLWDPYHCGGAPLFGNAQTAIISLNFLFVLLFGTVIGLKISIFVHFVIGFLGFYLLAKRHYSISSSAAIVGSTIFSFSGVVPSALGVGMITFLSFFYIPYVFYFLLNSFDKKHIKNTFLSGLFLAIIFYTGYHIAFWFIPIFAVYSVVMSIKRRSVFPILMTLLMLVFFVFISAPKLYGSVEFALDQPREINDVSGYKINQLSHFLFDEKQPYHPKEIVNGSFPITVDEQSIYIGIIPAVAFLLGLFYLNGRWEILLMLMLSAWLMLGSNINPSLWEHLKKLSFYDTARVAERFRYPFILFVSLISSFGIQGLGGKLKKSLLKNRIIILIFIVIFTDLLLFNYTNFFSKSFVIKNKDWDLNEREGFFQQQSNIYPSSNIVYTKNFPKDLRNISAYVPYSREFVGIKENIGVISCVEPVYTVLTGFVKGREDGDYQGESYFLSGKRKVNYVYWSPNKLVLEVEKGQPDRLIINQNYDDNWLVRINGKVYKVDSYRRLLSFMIDENLQKVEFIYKYIPLKHD